MRRTASGSVVLAAAITLAPAASAATDEGTTLDRRLLDPVITESSDLVASRIHAGLLWTTNDSGDGPFIYGVGRSGRTVARVSLAGVEARDWEALAGQPDANGRLTLWVGDIGDNDAVRDSVSVYRVREPGGLGEHEAEATRYDLAYPDGPRDAETLLVDPRDGRLYVVSKRASRAAVYVAPRTLSTAHVNTLTRVADAPTVLTDGAFSADGSRVVLRDYLFAYVAASVEGPWERLDVPFQRQGESVTWTPDGTALLLGSEGEESGVWRVEVAPAGSVVPSPSESESAAGDPTPTPSPTPSPSPLPDDSDDSDDGTQLAQWFMLPIGLAVGLAIAAAVTLRRR